jgi:predicted GIY-YIG superfamily endonuclease
VASFVYILRCVDGSFYVGRTDNLEGRVRAHQEGRGCAFTAARTPVILEYSERFERRAAAYRRELQIKRWTRAKKEALIANDRALLKRL